MWVLEADVLVEAGGVNKQVDRHRNTDIAFR